MQSARSTLDAVVVDLDGTILDCAERHYACYAETARELNLAALGPAAYRAMKRQRAPWTAIFAAAGKSFEPQDFERRFADKIEDHRLLELDRIFDGGLEALFQIRQLASMVVLVTMRRRQEALRVQLERLAISRFFDDVRCRGMAESLSKATLASQALPLHGERLAWIGDTEEDVISARAVGARACCVWSGLRDRTYLESLAPDLLAKDLSEVVRLLGPTLSKAANEPDH